MDSALGQTRLPAPDRDPDPLALFLSRRPKDRRLSNFDQFFVGLAITVSELDGGSRNGDPIDLFWQINPQEMLSGLMVAAFVILLDTAIVVVCSMVTFPLIDLVFKKKSKPAPAHVETWHPGGLAAHHAELSGLPWLAMRSDFLRPDAVPHSQLMRYPTAQECAVERITPLKARGSVGARPGPVTTPATLLTSNRKAA